MGSTMFDVQRPFLQNVKLGGIVGLPIDEHVWVCSMFKRLCSSPFDVQYMVIRPILFR